MEFNNLRSCKFDINYFNKFNTVYIHSLWNSLVILFGKYCSENCSDIFIQRNNSYSEILGQNT